jgi:hypothetical protein
MNGDKPKKDRAYFDPLVEKLAQNFERTLATPYGKFLKGLYVYGSYARNEPECGDVDVLFSVRQSLLRKETKALQNQMLLGFEELNFKKCEEYPDCTDEVRPRVPDCARYGSCSMGEWGIGDLAKDRIIAALNRHLLRGLTKLRNDGTIHWGLCYTIQKFISDRDLDKKRWKIKLLSLNLEAPVKGGR